MSVSCGLTECPEALAAAMESEKKLQEVAAEFSCERNSELATLYLEARNKLEELKIQLKKQTKKDDLSNNDLQLLTGEGTFKIISLYFNFTNCRGERHTVLHSLHPEGF